MMIHFLQSPAWQSFQQAEGRTTFLESGPGWHFLAILETGSGFRRLYCPYGPVAKDRALLEVALQRLRDIALENRIDFLRLQPTGTAFTSQTLTSLGMNPIHYSQPSHTWRIDLTPSEDEILAGMRQNNRNLYRNYTKKGLVYEKSHNPDDIHRLTTLLHHTAQRNDIAIHSDRYLESQATALMPDYASLHFLTIDGETVAAAMIYEGEDMNYYAHAAGSYDHRKLGAPTALLAEIIMDAKRSGKTSFDCFGIAPNDDPDHKWAGFTKFKQSFGGYAFDYPNTHELPIHPLRYRAYQLLRKLR